jgi:prevent-host-death family protein
MKKATVSQAKNHLSELLAAVKRGESVLILERDRPIAQLVPLEAGGIGDDARLAELERRGVLRRAKRRPGANFLKSLPPALRTEADVVGALLAERDEGR